MNNIPYCKRTPSKWEVSDALQEAVSKYITDNPSKYNSAQEFGDFITSHSLSQVDSFEIDPRDIAGEQILYQELHKLMRCHGFKPKDMDRDEIDRLKINLGEDWKEQLIQDYDFTIDDFSAESTL